MPDERFWTLIDQARAGTSASASPERLTALLNQLGEDEVSDFGHTFYENLCDLNHWRLWGAGYVVAGGMSDDSFHYFRSWIVGKGKQVFDVARTDPDQLGPYIDTREVDNELLEYVAMKILKRRGIEEDPGIVRVAAPTTNLKGSLLRKTTRLWLFRSSPRYSNSCGRPVVRPYPAPRFPASLFATNS